MWLKAKIFEDRPTEIDGLKGEIMNKEYFDSLNIYKQTDVRYIVKKAIEEMIKDQFTFAQMTAFVELTKEEIGNLDVVPRNMIESRRGVVCGGPTEANPHTNAAEQRAVGQSSSQEEA
jgi:hypothetical protein